MSIYKKMAILIPCLALAGSAAFVLANRSSDSFAKVEAAEYISSDRDYKVNEDGSISIKFTVSETNLNMRGWLLCFFNSKPSVNDARKLDNSNNLHPYSVAECAHYFYAASEYSQGVVDVTWAANAEDQKQNWTAAGGTAEEGYTLKDYYDDDDWYLVVGPRHFENSWGHDNYGEGIDDIWENCDYLLGQRSALEAASSYGNTVFRKNDQLHLYDEQYYMFEGNTVTGAEIKTLLTSDSNDLDIVDVNYDGVRGEHILIEYQLSPSGVDQKYVAFADQYGTAPYGFYLAGNGTEDLPYTFIPLHTAVEYASYFLAQTNFCEGYDGVTDNYDNLVGVWTELSRYYSHSLEASQKQELVTSNNATIDEAMSRYEYVVGKYGLTHFITGRTPVVNPGNRVVITSSNDYVPLVVAAIIFSVSITAAAVIFFIRKRKHQ